MIFRGKAGEFLQLLNEVNSTTFELTEKMEEPLSFIWFLEDNVQLEIDGKLQFFSKHEVICITEFYKIKIIQAFEARLIRFNRQFYCILENDIEVGCNGLLFFGTAKLPQFNLPLVQIGNFDTLWNMFVFEVSTNDELQLDMLRSLLKRFTILCTNFFKLKYFEKTITKSDIELIRDFNLMVDLHFRTKSTLQEFASMLHKSPKTISNVFSKQSAITPLQYIQERKLLEAKRLLKYTDKKIFEISDEIGFKDVQTFSRFFKNLTKMSPSNFKAMEIGKN
ncbi:MAG: helix-turn-helix transcriptional regulator [Saprospiraceae bacterium]|jgi:AraC-like DNA-binding protein